MLGMCILKLIFRGKKESTGEQNKKIPTRNFSSWLHTLLFLLNYYFKIIFCIRKFVSKAHTYLQKCQKRRFELK